MRAAISALHLHLSPGPLPWVPAFAGITFLVRRA
jgi:hypothetical protein